MVQRILGSGFTHTQRTHMGGMAGGMHVEGLPRHTETSTFRTRFRDTRGINNRSRGGKLTAGNIYIIHIRMQTHACSNACMFMHTSMHVSMHAYTHTHTHTCMHACT